MSLLALLDELERRGITVVPRPDGNISVRPWKAVPLELQQHLRAEKTALTSYLRAEQDRASADRALELLNCLKGYTLPAGRMPAARALALRMRRLNAPAEILSALQNFEGELIGLGGEYDAQLAEAVDIVHRTFPGARLVK